MPASVLITMCSLVRDEGRRARRRGTRPRVSPGRRVRSRSGRRSPRPCGAIRPAVRAQDGHALQSPSPESRRRAARAGIAPETLSLRSFFSTSGSIFSQASAMSTKCRLVPGRARRVEQGADALVALLVQRMAHSRGSTCRRRATPSSPRAPPRADRGQSSGVRRTSVYMRPAVSDEPSTDRAAAEHAGSDGTLHRVGRGGEGHARGLHARHQARALRWATSVPRLSTAVSPPLGMRPLTSRKKWSTKEILPISSFARVVGRGRRWCGSSDVQIAVRGDRRLADLHAAAAAVRVSLQQARW